jgi:hypothetical protein
MLADVVANEAWLLAAICATDLLAWTRTIALPPSMARATPKTIRYRILHIAGRLSTKARVLHFDRNWSWTRTILRALERIQHTFEPRRVTNPPPALTG